MCAETFIATLLLTSLAPIHDATPKVLCIEDIVILGQLNSVLK